MKSKIARKLIIYTIVFSSAITLVLTTLQLYGDYNYDVKNINQSLSQIKESYTQSITDAVWLSDRNQLQTVLDGITKLPDIVYAEVIFSNNEIISSSPSKASSDISLEIELNYRYNNKDILIGRFVTVATLDDVYDRLLSKLWIILLSNAFKTMLVALFIYMLFTKLVTRHLENISDFVIKDELETLSEPLTLAHRDSYDEPDEFDVVVAAINKLRLRLHNHIEELDEKKQYLALTLNSIGDAVITTNENGQVTSMNPVAEELTGWTEEQAQRQPLKMVFSIIDATTREIIENPVEKVITTGETVYLSNHTTLIAKDGRESQIADSAAPIRDHDGKILGMVLVFNDVTVQYQLRQSVEKSKRDLQAIIDNSSAVIYTKDLEGKFIFVNRQFEKLFGVNRDEVAGKTNHDIFSAEIADAFRRNDVEVLAKKKTIEFEEVAQHDDGLHTYISNKFPLLDESGYVYAMCGISTDVTEHIRQNEQLRQAQKMDALGKLTGGIAHDYNNMLNIILGYTELLSEAVTKQPELLEYVHEIRHAGERGAQLTKKLLDFSRHKVSKAVELNINTLLREGKHMLEKTLTARINVVEDLADDLWPVWLDSNDLEDAIINMSINAMHAIDGSGKLTLQTINTYLNTNSAKRLDLELGDYVLLNIIDTGCGMDEVTKEKLFDPFYSTKGEHGTGLGLSQVYGFVERSGGAIKVYSELGQGSRFALYFPRYHSNAENQKLAQVRDSADLRGDETILIVDDEPVLLKLALTVLGRYGYRVVQAENAQQALVILENESVDLMISDIIMPEMDGYQLATIVREKYPDVKIQLASGFADGQDLSPDLEELQQNLLYKPYDLSSLLTRVRELLD